jgi:glutaminyl-peptide cyclotransferase
MKSLAVSEGWGNPMKRRTIAVAALVLAAFVGVYQLLPIRWSTRAQPGPEPKAARFAEDRAPAETKAVPFDAKRAMGYLETLCNIGPRISGSEGMAKQQKLLQDHFEKFGGAVAWQRFEGKQPTQKQPIPMANMIVSWKPDAKRRIILCGHYDTRPIADQEERRADWDKPFLSANDGTSTIAFLMELAHHMKEIPTQVGVDFVLFDGEECIYDRDRDRYFIGSDHFAQEYKKERPAQRYTAAVLMDMIAGKGAKFTVEQNSHSLAGDLCEQLWAEAKLQGVDAFIWERGPDVLDDHLGLNRVGIPAVDVIDFSYRHWHKLSDLPENCSGESMANVAKVIVGWMQRTR